MEKELVNVSQSSIAQALATDYFCIYYVNVEDDRFIEYSASPEYRQLGLPTMGDGIRLCVTSPAGQDGPHAHGAEALGHSDGSEIGGAELL